MSRWMIVSTMASAFRLTGRVSGRLHVIVFAYRGTVCRIISARKANARERREHDAAYQPRR